jgi:dTDP-4-amino-4,6-dideoxygalactose transaminase
LYPSLDPAAHHAPVRDQIQAAGEGAAARQDVLGPEVEAFEQGFARMIGAKTPSASARPRCPAPGLRGGRCQGRRRSDRPGNTFIATALAVSALGAVPVLVDCDPVTLTSTSI